MLKLTTLSCLIFLLVNRTFSQNYQPINSGRVSNFVTQFGANYIFNTKVDKIVMNGSDSIFFSYIQYPNTTTFEDFAATLGTDASRISWWGTKAIISSNGNATFITGQNDSILLKTQAPLSDSWVMCQLSSDSVFYATVTNIQNQSVLGNPENVKEIRIELRNASNQVMYHPFNGKTILIGENSGFVKAYNFSTFPKDYATYQLTGIDGQNGIQNMTPIRLYDFQVGDTLDYQLIDDQSIMDDTYKDLHYKILSKVLSGSQVSYNVHRIQYWWYESGADTIITNDTIQLTYQNSPVYYHNKYDLDAPYYAMHYEQYIDIYGEHIVKAECPDCDFFSLIIEENYAKGYGHFSKKNANYDYHGYTYTDKLLKKNNLAFDNNIGIKLSSENITLQLNCNGTVTASYPNIANVQYEWKFEDGASFTGRTSSYQLSSLEHDTLQLTLTTPTSTFVLYKFIDWSNTGSKYTYLGSYSLGSSCDEVLLYGKKAYASMTADSIKWFLPDGSIKLGDTISYRFQQLVNNQFKIITYDRFCWQNRTFSLDPQNLSAFPVAPSCAENKNGTSSWGDLYQFSFKNATFKNQVSELCTKGCLEQNCYVGENISLSICAGKSNGTKWQGSSYQIWLDFNNDGIFDNSEKIANGLTPDGAYVSDYKYNTFNFTIPGTAVKNTKLRMRVSIGGSINNPCSGKTYDFSMRIYDSNFSNPLAQNDSVSVNEDTDAWLAILANDSDADGSLDMNSLDLNPALPENQTSFSNSMGSYTFDASLKTLKFHPTVNFNGTSSITYTIRDNEGFSSNIATIVVQVQAVNDAPTAKMDAVTTSFNTAISIDLLNNDSDEDSAIDPLSIDLDVVQSGIQNTYSNATGSWTVTGSNQVLFTPSNGYSGTSITQYTVADAQGAVSGKAEIKITVLNYTTTPLTAPIAINDTIHCSYNSTSGKNVLANDIAMGTFNNGSINLNPYGTSRTAVISTSLGTFNCSSGSNYVSFSPLTGAIGTTSIEYTIANTNGLTSNIAKIVVIIDRPSNLAPKAMDDYYIAYEDNIFDAQVLGNDFDPDPSDFLNPSNIDLNSSVAGIQNPFTNGFGTWYSFDLSGSIRFEPSPNFNGTASIKYAVADGSNARSNTATLSITVIAVNDAPVAFDDWAYGNANDTASINPFANDTDVDGVIHEMTVDLDTLTPYIQQTLTTSVGTWSYNSVNRKIDFIPLDGYEGITKIGYSVEDNLGLRSNIAILTAQISSVNQIPVATNDAFSTNEDVSKSFNITSNDFDPDGSLLISKVDLDTIEPGIQISKLDASGNWSVNSSGLLTFVPTPNYAGTTKIWYTIQDNVFAVSNSASITVSVIAVNDAPVAFADSANTLEDQVITVDVKVNDYDIDGTISQIIMGLNNLAYTTTEGFWDARSGKIVFTPKPNFYGIASTYYYLKDNGNASSNSVLLKITVNPVNDAPLTQTDTKNTNEDVAIAISVTDNDSDVDGTLDLSTLDLDAGTAALEQNIDNSYGNWQITSAGVVFFTPLPNFTGTAFLTYRLADNLGLYSVATSVIVTVGNINDAPIAVSDSSSTFEDLALSINILANDYDIDNAIDPNSLDLDPNTSGIQQIFSNAAGVWTAYNPSEINFVPSANFNGTASIKYVVADINGLLSNQATLSISVTSVNDAPIAVDNSGSCLEESSIVLSILLNDYDVDGSLLNNSVDLDSALAGIQQSFSTTSGNWLVSSTGLLSFQPAPDFFGIASIAYSVSDNSGGLSNYALVSITVNNINDVPNALADSISTIEDANVNLLILFNDTDVDNAINAATVDLNPFLAGLQQSQSTTQGLWTVNLSGLVQFSPAPDFYGIAQLKYTVKDQLGLQSNPAIIAVTVTPVNDAPVAFDDLISTNEDISVSFSIINNDSDVENGLVPAQIDLDPFSVGLQQNLNAMEGNWSVDPAGNITFIPNPDFNGSTQISYTIPDLEGLLSGIATITVTVNSANDLPIAMDDSGSTNEEFALSIDLVVNDTDADGSIDISSVDLDTILAGIQNNYSTADGTWSVDGSGMLTFSPAIDFAGSASVNYFISDNLGGQSNAATITITVNNVNDAPIAVSDSVNSSLNDAVTYNVFANDSDADNNIDFTSVDLDPSTPGIQNTLVTAEGNFSVNNLGEISFTPTVFFAGNAVITYQISDLDGLLSNNTTFTVFVAAGIIPLAVNDSGTTLEETNLTINVLANDSDADGNIVLSSVDLNQSLAGIQQSLTNTQGSWTVDANGILTFVPALNFNGNASIKYSISDNDGLNSNLATITIVVSAVNDAPLATDNSGTTNEDNPLSINLVANDSDPDGTINAATVDLSTITSGIQNTINTSAGNWSVNSSGILTFTPALNYNGTASINYELADNGGLVSNVATITIVVIAVNDAPKTIDDVATTAEESLLAIPILSNDSDVDGTIQINSIDLNPSMAGIQQQMTTSTGFWSVDAFGQVLFTPELDYEGFAVISYTVKDDLGLISTTATLTVNVTGVNDFPLANDDNDIKAEDETVQINLISNDIDIDGTIDPSSIDLDPSGTGIQKTMSSADGDWSVDVNGILTFVPFPDFNGIISISYVIADNSGDISNPANIEITLQSINDAPIALNDSLLISEGQMAQVDVTSNDFDVDGFIQLNFVDLDPGVIGVQNLVVTAAGTWSSDPSGFVFFAPNSEFNGNAVLYYGILDNLGLSSNIASISIEVIGINDAPIANDNSGITQEDQSLNLDIVSNDSDIDGTLDLNQIDLEPGIAGIQQSTTSAQGSWQVDASGSLTFVPNANFNGTASITYVISDNEGALSNPAEVSFLVTPVNDAPLAGDDNQSSDEDLMVQLNLVANDFDVDGTLDLLTLDLDPGTIGIQQSMTGLEGMWTVDTGGILTFVPLQNFNGTANLSYVISDETGAVSNSALITINVIPLNDAPIALDDSAAMNQNESLNLSVALNDWDLDGTLDLTTIDLDTLTAGLQQNRTTSAGNWSLTSSGILTFTPDPTFNGLAEIHYTLKDNLGLISNVARIRVVVIPNLQALLMNDTLTISQGETALISVLNNDMDPDGVFDLSSLDLSAADGVQTNLTTSAGMWSTDGTGIVQFVPVSGFTGTTSIHYRIADNDGLLAADAKITVFVKIDPNSGVAESPEIMQLSLFPNPASSVLHIKAENLRQIRVYSAIGQLIYEGASENNIDVGAWSTGLYFVEASFENGKFVRKEFVKE